MKPSKRILLFVTAAIMLLGIDDSVFAQRIVATIPVGVFPQGVAVNRLTNRIYVANEFGQFIPPFTQIPNTISVIDGARNRVVDDIVTGLDFQIGVGLDEYRNLIYVATLDSGVDVMDGKTDEVIANIPFDGEPVFPGTNPFTKSAYVTNQRGSVSLLDEDENKIVTTIALNDAESDGEPEGVAVDPITNRIYVANLDTVGSVWAIDGRSNTIMATIPVGISPFGIAVNIFTGRVYEGNSCNNTMASLCQDTVSVIDERTNKVAATVAVDGIPVAVAVDELRNLVYTGNGSPGGVSIINGKNNQLLTTIPLGDPNSACAGLAVNALTNLAYCTNPESGSVTVIRGPGKRRHSR